MNPYKFDTVRAATRSRAPAALVGLAVFCLAAWSASARANEPADPLSLEEQLLQEDAAQVAREAREHGDPRRGAIVFHQPHVTCTKCHATGQGTSPLGPDLARREDQVTDPFLVEAVLRPSKTIRQGFEPLLILLADGTTLTGLLVEERADSLIVRDVEQAGKIRQIPTSDIEQHRVSKQSIMPTGLVNLAGSRQAFLDLMAYLFEISEHGPQRALELAPPPRAPDTSVARTQVYRTMMPQSGPASLAIGLGDGLWICFDPQRGGVNYAWSGSLDLSPTVAQKINEPARIEGTLFYRDNNDRPLRPDDPTRLPTVQFRGYRLMDDAVEIQYNVDDLLVHERLAALPEGAGLIREFRIEGTARPVWLVDHEQPSAEIEVRSAVREDGAWRIDLNESQVTVRMTIRAKEEPR